MISINKSFAVLLFITMFGLSCNQQKKVESEPEFPKDFDWLLGTWLQRQEKFTLIEKWSPANDSVLEAINQIVENGDTQIMEKINLVKTLEGIFYIPQVINQNGGLTVKFKLSSWKNKQYIFTNPAHDFPQNITYEQLDQNLMKASISGEFKGKSRKEEFTMKKENSGN